MITNRNPVYAALWFALVTLSTCGLFLLQSAPFLAAATIIVYAGAIVVTFLFVIMLAQQSGATVYDQRSRQPLLATVAAFVLLGRCCARCKTGDAGRSATWPQLQPPVATPIALSRPPEERADTARCTAWAGRCSAIICSRWNWPARCCSWPTIGAIAIAPRRAEGTL